MARYKQIARKVPRRQGKVAVKVPRHRRRKEPQKLPNTTNSIEAAATVILPSSGEIVIDYTLHRLIDGTIDNDWLRYFDSNANPLDGPGPEDALSLHSDEDNIDDLYLATVNIDQESNNARKKRLKSLRAKGTRQMVAIWLAEGNFFSLLNILLFSYFKKSRIKIAKGIQG